MTDISAQTETFAPAAPRFQFLAKIFGWLTRSRPLTQADLEHLSVHMQKDLGMYR